MATGSETIDHLVAANAAHADARKGLDSRPARQLAVVTCMDVRIDPLAAFGLRVGEAHVLRNAGGRVTDDVVRSLAVSSHVLGVDTVAVIEHSRCGMAGVSEEQLRQRTGSDLRFHVIGDHGAALREDVDRIAERSELRPITTVAGFVFDVETGSLTEVVRWLRP